METTSILPSRDTLLAAGFCLLFAGIILRNFVRNSQRALNYRKQHTLHRQTLAEASADLARHATFVEKHLPKLANGVLLLGAAAVVTALFRN